MCTGLCLGTVLLLLALVIAAHQRRARPRAGAPGPAAPPPAPPVFGQAEARGGADAAAADLGDSICAFLERTAPANPASAGPPAPPGWRSPRAENPGEPELALRWVRASLESAWALTRAPPTDANRRALYGGLRLAAPYLRQLAGGPLAAPWPGQCPNRAAALAGAAELDRIAQNIERLGAALG